MPQYEPKVGDEFTIYRHSRPERIVSVTKVTKRWFETGDSKWSFHGAPSPRETWATTHVAPTTDEHRDTIKRRAFRERIKSIANDNRLDDLTTAQLAHAAFTMEDALIKAKEVIAKRAAELRALQEQAAEERRLAELTDPNS